jgi:hypothetical protein
MRRIAYILAAAAVGCLLVLSGAPALAKSAKECRDEYAANKVTITANGQTETAYLSSCKASPAANSEKAPAAPVAARSTEVVTKTKADCAAEYTAHSAIIKANGQSKAAFDADCRAGTEKVDRTPVAVAPAPAAPAPPPDPMALKPSIPPPPAPAAPKP